MRPTKHLAMGDHRSEFPHPISFKKGALLVIGEAFDGSRGWENWHLCRVLGQEPGQEPGWVPGQIIQRLDGDIGRALEDYTARELDVRKGDVLRCTRALNGWLWCERQDGAASGWTPADILTEIPE